MSFLVGKWLDNFMLRLLDCSAHLIPLTVEDLWGIECALSACKGSRGWEGLSLLWRGFSVPSLPLQRVLLALGCTDSLESVSTWILGPFGGDPNGIGLGLRLRILVFSSSGRS